MRDFYRKNKLFLITVGFLAVVFVAVWFVFFPYISKIREQSDRVQEKIIDNEMARERSGKISQMEESFARFNENKAVTEVILDSSSSVEFIKDLERMAEETGNEHKLDIQDNDSNGNLKSKKQTLEKEEEKGIQESLSHKDYFAVSITLTGNYQELLNFMNKLENFKYYINVVSLNLKKQTISEVSSGGQSFSAGIFESSRSEEGIEKEAKSVSDTLKSVINIVVYTKK